MMFDDVHYVVDCNHVAPRYVSVEKPIIVTEKEAIELRKKGLTVLSHVEYMATIKKLEKRK